MKKENKIRYSTLIVDNIKYRTLLTKKHKNRKPYQEPELNIIKAFISGDIQNIFVKKGDIVKAGDKLVILEAMKMRNNITSPIDGVIKNINVKIKDKITKGTVIIELKN